MKFPPHLSLTLEHNEHKLHGLTLAEAIKRDLTGLRAWDCTDWFSRDELERALVEDEVWVATVFPNSVTSMRYAAPSLNALMEFIRLALPDTSEEAPAP